MGMFGATDSVNLQGKDQKPLCILANASFMRARATKVRLGEGFHDIRSERQV
jgi:hypothetical protein